MRIFLTNISNLTQLMNHPEKNHIDIFSTLIDKQLSLKSLFTFLLFIRSQCPTLFFGCLHILTPACFQFAYCY